MIYHILNKKEWEDSRSNEFYLPETFAKEGFIHCSAADKVEESANRFFREKSEIVILCIEEDRVKADIIYEDLYNTGFEFPHIYGALNLDSVQKAVFVRSENAGGFNIEKVL